MLHLSHFFVSFVMWFVSSYLHTSMSLRYAHHLLSSPRLGAKPGPEGLRSTDQTRRGET